MVEDRDEKPHKRRRRVTPEETWIRGFLEFSGTDNITRVCRADLNGLSLTLAIEAIFLGEMTSSMKCDDGPGAICTFQYEADVGIVEVEVFFVAGEMTLEIRGAMTVEVRSEPNDAA
jgi:hypothetical protein